MHPVPGTERFVSDVVIAPDDPLRPDVVALLQDHLSDMHATSPAESVHALDPAALTAPGLPFWTARTPDGGLLGTVALKELHEVRPDELGRPSAPGPRNSARVEAPRPTVTA